MTGHYSAGGSSLNAPTVPIRTWWVDERFVETLNISIIKGRNFSAHKEENNMKVLINRDAMETLGFDEPVGSTIVSDGTLAYTIVGVVENFHYESLREQDGPAIINYSDGTDQKYMFIKLDAMADLKFEMENLHEVWNSFDSADPMEYYFLDEAFNMVYRIDRIAGKLSIGLGGIAIFICIGLLGMISFTSKKRTKEIGVRKVFGASTFEIVRMLLQDLFLLVLFSLLLAAPFAWWVTNNWMSDFAYRIDVQWWVFAFSGMTVLIVVLLTTTLHALKASLTSPVDSLRDE